jgi:GYF domain 2
VGGGGEEFKMQIFVLHNQVRIGPFTFEEIRARLAGGEILLSDPAWHAGLSGWVPLKDVLTWSGGGVVPPPLPVQQSAMWPGVVAIGCAVIALVLLGLMISVVAQGRRAESAPGEFLNELVGTFILFGMTVASGICSSLVGILALRARNRMNLAGLLANAFILLFFAMSLATGVFRRGERGSDPDYFGYYTVSNQLRLLPGKTNGY